MNNKNPKISIVVPVYNVEIHLDRCINSILDQTFNDSEIVLVDDGSPDRCPEMCDSYAEKYENIYVIHKENGGLASARLAGFDIAKGEYILFIDSDDYIDKYMVEKMVAAADKEQAELAICGYNTVCDGNISPNKLPYKNECISGREKIVKDYILPIIGRSATGFTVPSFLWIRLFKRSLIQKTFFGSERKYNLEDRIFNLYYADMVNKIAVVNETLYYYCVNKGSLTNSYKKNIWEMNCNLYKFCVDYIRDRKIDDNDGRLKSFLCSSVFLTVDSAVLSGKYTNFKEEFIPVIESDLAKGAITSVDKRLLSLMQKLTLLMIKTHMYLPLYMIRKRRLKKFF